MKTIQTILAILTIAFSNAVFAQSAPTIDSLTGGGLFYVGDSTVLNAYTTGDPADSLGLSYEVKFGGSLIATSSTYSLDSILTFQSGYYTFVVTGVGGSDSDSVFVSVVPLIFTVAIDSIAEIGADSAKVYKSYFNTCKYIDPNYSWGRYGLTVNLDSTTAFKNVPFGSGQLVDSLYNLQSYSKNYVRGYAWNIQTGNYVTPLDSFMTLSSTPQIDSLVANVKIVGDTASISIYGKNFVNGSVAEIDGNAKATTFVNDSLLQMAILFTDVDSLGSFSVAVFNPGGGGLSNGVNFTVICGPASIDTLSVSAVLIVGQFASDTMSTYGLNGGISWSITQGTLLSGQSFDTVAGVVAGIPNALDTASYTIRATDSLGCSAQGNIIQVSICPGASWNSVIADTLYVGELGPNDTLKMFNGNPIANYSVLPGITPGRSLDTATGIISGTPSVTGLVNYIATGTDIFGCQSTDNVGQWVVCDTVSLDTMTNVGTVGQPFGGSVQVSGTGSFSLSSTGQLPQTLSLDTSNGTFPGILTVEGSSNFAITATNEYGCSGVRNYSVTASCPNAPMLFDTLATLVVGELAANDTMDFTNDNTLQYWSAGAGMTPGRSLDSLFGLISGTPNQKGTYNWNVTRTDIYGCTRIANLTQTVVCDTPVISITLVNDTIVVNQAPVDTPTVSGNGNFTWSISQGTQPNGRTIDPSTGLMTDTADTKGTYNFTLKAVSNYGCSALVNVTQVVVCGTLSASITLSDTLAEGIADSGQVNIAGGVAPYYYSVSGLPLGMNYNYATGAIYGTPSDSGTYVISATVTDVKGCSVTVKDTVVVTKYYIVANGTVVLSSTSLMFSGTVMNNNSATNSAWITYGVSPNLNQQIVIGAMPTGTSPITEIPTGLQPNTKYCWQLFANNAVSPDTLCATTLQAVPQAISAGVSAITKTSALITFVQNSGGGSAQATLTYYDNDSVSLGSPIVKTAIGTQNVLFPLNNLPAGETVNFKIVETNSVGADSLYGSFITLDYSITVTNVYRTCYLDNMQLVMFYSSDDPLAEVWIGYEPDSILTGAYLTTMPEALPTGANKQFVKVVTGLASGTEYAASFFIKKGNNAVFTTSTDTCTTEAALAVDEAGISNWFKIFPNPMTASAEITSSTDGVLVLQNALGAEVMKVKVVSGRGVVDRQNLPAGLYYHHLFDKDGIKRHTGKILIE